MTIRSLAKYSVLYFLQHWLFHFYAFGSLQRQETNNIFSEIGSLSPPPSSDKRQGQTRHTHLTPNFGRAIAQAVSRWLPTEAARVRARVWSNEICGGQSGARAGFLQVLRFPCQSAFHQILHPHNHPGQVQ
jgi:hypothetical protein